LNTKEDISKNVGQLTVAIDFYSNFFLLWKSMGCCLLTNILQNVIFCVQKNKETHTGWEQLEGE